jgi:hypothetical protein
MTDRRAVLVDDNERMLDVTFSSLLTELIESHGDC